MASSPAAAAAGDRHLEGLAASLSAAVDRVVPERAVGDVGCAALPSLLTALAAVPDPRRRRGVRHDVLVVLVCACAAVLAGQCSYVALAQWTAARGRAVAAALGWAVTRLPSESTLRRCLQRIDARALEAALCSWAGEHLVGQRHLDPSRRLLPKAEATRVIAVDGKTLRGSAARGNAQADALAAAGGGRIHLVSAIDVEAGVVLAQGACDLATGKGGEIAGAATVLADLHERGLLAGSVVTMDALHTQRSHAQWLHDADAHWIFTVKGNQPRLLARCKALNWTEVPVGARIRDAGHGRRETRTIYVLSLESIPDGLGDFFDHAAQVIKLVRRRRTTRGTWTVEVLYAITSLTYQDAHPALLASWIRGHWCIENRLHWIRDVTFAEDASQIHTASGPQVMAALRNLAINALRLTGHTNIAAGLREHALDPLLPLTTLGLT